MENKPEITPEQRAEIDKRRTIQEAEFLKNGAEYSFDEKGDRKLNVPQDQIRNIQEEKENARYREFWRNLREGMFGMDLGKVLEDWKIKPGDAITVEGKFLSDEPKTGIRVYGNFISFTEGKFPDGGELKLTCSKILYGMNSSSTLEKAESQLKNDISVKENDIDEIGKGFFPHKGLF